MNKNVAPEAKWLHSPKKNVDYSGGSQGSGQETGAVFRSQDSGQEPEQRAGTRAVGGARVVSRSLVKGQEPGQWTRTRRRRRS